MTTVKTREERLPKWAQGELERLRRRVEEVEATLRREYGAGVASGATFYVPGSLGSDPAPIGSRYIECVLNPEAEGRGRSRLRLRVDDGSLEIMGLSDRLAIRPQATNLVRVASQD